MLILQIYKAKKVEKIVGNKINISKVLNQTVYTISSEHLKHCYLSYSTSGDNYLGLC